MSYLQAFEANSVDANAYLAKSIASKTEQQKRLEQILTTLNLAPARIADIACGAGSLSLHLSRLYQTAEFTLVDLGEIAIRAAKETAKSFNGRVVRGNACALELPSDSFDLTFFWQTLLAIDSPGNALKECIRVTRPGGRIFASSLFNTDFDVDLMTYAIDHTRQHDHVRNPYNTYCARTVRGWIAPLEPVFHDFPIDIDIERQGRGVGTFTVPTATGRLQVSAGILMNWKILEIHKTS